MRFEVVLYYVFLISFFAPGLAFLFIVDIEFALKMALGSSIWFILPLLRHSSLS